MRQRFAKPRTGWAALPVAALAASLLAAGASTATATTDTPDERSRVSACVGQALDDRDFTDVPDDHLFHDSINCLAHYGITIGTGDGTTFSPDEPVKRWQMMLFLSRALDPAGISVAAARAQNFTDVDDLGPETLEAIELLVTNGIAAPAPAPAPAGTFDPDGIVDRAEMALLLVRFLHASESVVNITSSGSILLDANGDGSQSEPDDYFKDARDEVPVNADLAISASYELGITTGVGPTPVVGDVQPGLDFYYRPGSPVTRGQMAAFIIRTLAHTLARPKGVSAQYDGSEIRVSVRDDNFAPVADAPVDMFYIDTEDAGLAFTSQRACSGVEEFVDGSHPCEIDSSDLVTDEEGEVSLTVPQPILDGADTTVWVWTGRSGDMVGRATDLVRLDVEPSVQAQPAVRAEISTPFRGVKARFGTTVTFTVQLKDAQGRDVAVGVDGERPVEWEFTEELLDEAAGTVDGMLDESAGERLLSKTPTTLRSDSRGRVTFSLSVPDPNRGAAGHSRTRTYSLVGDSNAPVAPFAGSEGFADGMHFLEFSDEPPVLANSVVELTVPSGYVNAPSSGSARNTASVSVRDEYGAALAAATVRLASDKSSISTQSFSVGRDGVHRFSYSYDRAEGVVETLTATVDPDGMDSTANNLDDVNAYMFWPALTVTRNTDGARHVVLFGDADRNEIIVDVENSDAGDDWPVGADPASPDTVPERVVYDNNDRFDVQGPGDAEPRPVGSIEDFEGALAQYLAVAPTGDAGTGACLEWADYDSARSRFVAEFRLWTDCP